MRDFAIEDLLYRRAVDVIDEKTAAWYRGKSVLITGGGGSIGSELARQIAKIGPERLTLLDIYENGVYDIQQELRQRHPDLNLQVEIANVCDKVAIDRILKNHTPDIILHAAAHKHVPLMERNVMEAVQNNVFGTLNMVEACERNGVKRFIMVSTDKAVNPTNVMGATKRMCEMIVQSRKGDTTSFSATRFGNVLGSNGSVIPLFRRQIANGGPVTVTDKRITRYFMTIPEASQLVKRCEHWYTEFRRVEAGTEAWRNGDIEKYGRLSFESGWSSIHNWESGAPEQIRLYEIMRETPGIYGGRFSGAGFKGCCMALIDPEKADSIRERVEREYLTAYPEMKGKYSFHLCESADGIANQKRDGGLI